MRVPTKDEAEILRRNGINEDDVCVRLRQEHAIHLLNYNTRDNIVIFQGDKSWDSYRETIGDQHGSQ